MQEKNLPSFKEDPSDVQTMPGRAISQPDPIGSISVVGIGLSMGGYESMSRLLDFLSPSLGIVYVVVQQLPRGQSGIIPALLAGRTKMKVVKAKEGMLLEKDHVYLLPPDTCMSIVEGRLIRPSLVKKNLAQYPIDFFLMQLAELHREKAMAIILSGDTLDGVAGAQAVSKAGGITMAQDDTAKFRKMPRHAVDSGYIDFVLPPERIASQLASLRSYSYFAPRAEEISHNNKELGKIYLELVNRYQVDFNHCSQESVVRRIKHRMRVSLIRRLEDYAALLVNNPVEIDLLYRGLSADMMQFFREPSLFKQLAKQVLPSVLKLKNSDEFVRIWVPCCHTAEDVYSLAINLWEYCKTRGVKNPIRIFATDSVRTTVERAGRGIFSQAAMRLVSPSRRQRFFEKRDGGFRVKRDIRDLCVFAVHDLLKDPPFSSIDIISCDGVHFQREFSVREKILQLFHYALKPTGFLLTGRNEEIASGPDALFLPIDAEQRIYARNDVPAGRQIDFSFFKAPMVSGQEKSSSAEKEAVNVLLSRYVPASILVDMDLQVVRFFGVVSPYLRPEQGKASLKLFKMVRDELVFVLHSLLDKLKTRGQGTIVEQATLLAEEATQEISLEIVPVKSSIGETQLLIIIRELTPAQSKKKATPGRKKDSEQRDYYIRKLEKSLQEARQQILLVSSAFEEAREELQQSHEEMMSSNEELQSVNRQLEIFHEELQSVNEELAGANQKLLRANDC